MTCWSTLTLTLTREAPQGAGTSIDEIAPTSSEDQSEQVSFQRPTSILLKIHPDPTGYQTRQSKAQTNQICQSTHRRQINLVICRIVQLLPEPYPELRNHSGTTVQADTAGLRIPIRTVTQSSITSLPGTDIGLSEIWPRIPPHYKCLHSYHRTTRRTLCNIGTTEQPKPDPGDLKRFQTIKRKWEKLHTISARNSSCCLGDGQLQQIPERITIHSIHGSNCGSRSRHHTNEDVEQIENSDEWT